MTFLIVLILLWQFGLIDFSYKPIQSVLTLVGTLIVWLGHLWWSKLN